MTERTIEPMLEPSQKPDAAAILALIDETVDAMVHGDTLTAKRLLREVSAAVRGNDG